MFKIFYQSFKIYLYNIRIQLGLPIINYFHIMHNRSENDKEILCILIHSKRVYNPINILRR